MGDKLTDAEYKQMQEDHAAVQKAVELHGKDAIVQAGKELFGGK